MKRIIFFVSCCFYVFTTGSAAYAQQKKRFPDPYVIDFNPGKWKKSELNKSTDRISFTDNGIKLFSTANNSVISVGRSDIPVREGYYKVTYRVSCKTDRGFTGIWIYLLDADKKIISSYTPGSKGVPNNCGEVVLSPYSFVFYVPEHTSVIDLNVGQRYANGYSEIKSIVISRIDAREGSDLLKKQPYQLQHPLVDYTHRVASGYPVKDKSLLFTPAENKQALDNIEKYPAAKSVVETVIAEADKWTKWNADSLLLLIPDASVPRGFDLNALGCPVHGSEIFNVGGTYPWVLDPQTPFKVKCPVGGETYPSNDFVQTGLKKKKAEKIDSTYLDDGWGWLSPGNERYWFVAYANHWTLYRTIQFAVLNLSRAYFLTKEPKYAHLAALLLHRIAEVYPPMNHANQSRYGSMQKIVGSEYGGKVVNLIWETSFITSLAESYDEVWNAIDKDIDLQKRLRKTGKQIRSFIETNLLEDAMDAYYKGRIKGNFGMHQTTLLYLILARQYTDMPKMLAGLLDSASLDQSYMGARYALYNRVFRDGMPLESPGYNIGWVDRFAVLSYLLKKAGYDLYKDAKLKMLFDFPLKEIAIGKFTPDWGDTGSPLGGLQGNSLAIYRYVYPQYKDSAYLKWLAYNNLTGQHSFTTFDALFLPALPYTGQLPGGRAVMPQSNRLFAGYGWGFLNNKPDNVALSFSYGKHYSHSHWDFLNFEIFANNQKMMPDLGYPDAMNDYVEGIYTWSTNTVSHNTVMVDEKKQDRNLPGVLHDFSGGSFVQNMDASSPAYSKTSLYRRNMVMVSTGDSSAYVVDIFRVKGGKQHDYLLHGPPGQSFTKNGKWSLPASGTLAGKDVPWGKLYDDQRLGSPEYKGGYSSYMGSGFQYLFNVQTLESGAVDVFFKHMSDSSAQLKVHILDNQKQQVSIADAFDKPRSKKFILKYIVARRQGDEGLNSTFVSVIEPFKTHTAIDSVRYMPQQDTSVVLIAVHRGDTVDYIMNNIEGMNRQLPETAQTDARYAVWSVCKSSGKLLRGFISQGSFFKHGNKKEKSNVLKGKVIAVNPDKNTADIEVSEGNDHLDWVLKPVATQIAFFSNDLHETVHPLQEVEKISANVVRVKLDDAILIGRTPVSEVRGDEYMSATSLPFFSDYPGATLLDKDYRTVGMIRSAGISSFKLVGGAGKITGSNEPFWISNIGIGDRFEIKGVREF